MARSPQMAHEAREPGAETSAEARTRVVAAGRGFVGHVATANPPVCRASTVLFDSIAQADGAGIKDIVNQQFDVARQIISAGLVPIVEPEVDIHCPEKAKAEDLLKEAILKRLNELPANESVMLKLTIPTQDDFYLDCIRHPKVLRVVALSGGYKREEANDRLRRNHGLIASFSRALVEGLSAQQSDAEFNAMLDKYIQSIFDASNT